MNTKSSNSAIYCRTCWEFPAFSVFIGSISSQPGGIWGLLNLGQSVLWKWSLTDQKETQLPILYWAFYFSAVKLKMHFFRVWIWIMTILGQFSNMIGHFLIQDEFVQLMQLAGKIHGHCCYSLCNMQRKLVWQHLTPSLSQEVTVKISPEATRSYECNPIL